MPAVIELQSTRDYIEPFENHSTNIESSPREQGVSVHALRHERTASIRETSPDLFDALESPPALSVPVSTIPPGEQEEPFDEASLGECFGHCELVCVSGVSHV